MIGFGTDGTIEKCYSKADVSVTTANTLRVGGICAASASGRSGKTVTLCVALNNTISTPALTGTLTSRYVRRIFGGILTATGATIAMNYAPAIPLTGPVLSATGWTYDAQRDGTLLEEDPPEQWLYEVTLGWDFDEVWIMDSDGYPRLRGVDSN
jgi:hypothetical protein